mmetsp:Transcript_42545/g.91841  ORF Transcript_42545/g.91841 Transcript_42545/m.91841 type:complete len:95 (+) Transcript_42545:24-308(+)
MLAAVAAPAVQKPMEDHRTRAHIEHGRQIGRDELVGERESWLSVPPSLPPTFLLAPVGPAPRPTQEQPNKEQGGKNNDSNKTKTKQNKKNQKNG